MIGREYFFEYIKCEKSDNERKMFSDSHFNQLLLQKLNYTDLYQNTQSSLSLMAKLIKERQCPKCGSDRYTHLENQRFICDDCGTVYYFSYDDTGSSVRIEHRGTLRRYYHKSKKRKTKTPIIFVVIAALFAVVVANVLLSIDDGTLDKRLRSLSSIVESESGYTDRLRESYVYDNEAKVVVLSVVDRSYESKSDGVGKNGMYLVFRDLYTSEILSSSRLGGNNLSIDIDFFNNGQIFLILNNKSLYQINDDSYEIANVTKDILDILPGLDNDIAKLQFVQSPYSDGVEVVDAAGDHYGYYPSNGKLYGSKELNKVSRGFDLLSPDAEREVCYYFIDPSKSSTSEKSNHLVRFHYMYNGGGPAEDIGTCLKMGYFKYVGNGKYELQANNNFALKTYRILSYETVSSDRPFYNGKVYYSDESEIVIRYTTSLREDAPLLLQSIDANTMEENWLLELRGIEKELSSIFKTESGEYIGKLADNVFVRIASNGAVLQTLAID